MMRMWILSVFLLANVEISVGQEQDIMACINALWAGMAEANSTLASTCFDPAMDLRSVNSQGVMSFVNVEAWKKSIDNSQPNTLIENLINPSVLISQDGLAASVFGQYEFYYAGSLSHCGIDSFQMYWQNKRNWIIATIMDTQVPCDSKED
eukprot:TRINITY_DN15113_c0_g1_i6.p1 TRINITY_DN15113_c0_g1~~TRINITY_DN15113_c0_g1_i6.p1  ORF type:complete len:151 (-),score=2.70 TRINITY_DN15113_c0_g1_i6:12-464(-)